MKLFYECNGYKTYNLKILGYDCVLHETKNCGYQIQVPYGKTKKEKEMFDKLVYFNKDIYNGKTSKEVIAKVRKFIKTNR